ncbi:NTP transferase domain-containing protein [Streptosporangium sp. KLBMP 9127]|nr:NTP transferase domain-containing protein [Streptosporangium sp. KLBMP 9127]
MAARRGEQVVLLAGGLGSRLGRMAANRPKVLQDVEGGVFLDTMLEPVRASGLRRFHFCLGHLGAQVAGHLSALAGDCEITSEIEPAPLGTAGALLHSARHLDESFLVMLGDTYLDIDYGRLFDLCPEDMLGMMVLTRAASEVRPNVRLRDTTVTGYDKRGMPGGWVDTGVTFLRRRALDLLPRTGAPVDLGVLFRRLIDHGALAGTTTDRRFFDIGTPERHAALITHLRTRQITSKEPRR